MLSIIITLNQTKPKPAREVQKYLLNFYVFILNSGLTLCFLLSPGTESTDTQMPQGGCASSISDLAGGKELWKSHKKAFCVTLHREFNPPEKWWVRCSLQEKLPPKSERAAEGQPGWYYTFPAGKLRFWMRLFPEKGGWALGVSKETGGLRKTISIDCFPEFWILGCWCMLWSMTCFQPAERRGRKSITCMRPTLLQLVKPSQSLFSSFDSSLVGSPLRFALPFEVRLSLLTS